MSHSIESAQTLATLALLAGLATVPALAADAGPYLSLSAGVTGLSGQDLSYTAPGATTSGRLSPDTGFATGGAFGYRFAGPWRVEAEFMYRTADHDGLRLPGVGNLAPGNFASTAAALNALYEFDLFGSPRVRSFAGLGAVWLTEVDIDFESAGTETSFSGDGFGVQAIFGARYDLGERWFLESSVRYLAAGSVDLRDEADPVRRLDADYDPWSVTVGIGWKF
jgi:opacity protein-like surface antigen